MKIRVDNIVCTCIIGGLDNVKLDVYNELRTYLRVKPKNASQTLMYMRSNGNTGWDGYTYFINKKGVFATGFLPMVLEYLKELEVSVTLEDVRVNVPKFKTPPYDFNAPTFVLAPHQQELIVKSNHYLSYVAKNNSWHIYFPRGGWQAATNAGKTAASGNLLKNLIDPCAIMLLDDQGLLTQHYKYYSTLFPNPGDVGTITSSKMVFGNVLTLAMVRTLYNRIKQSPIKIIIS